MNKSHIAILASGTGSNAKALIQFATEQGFNISCLITDNPMAGVIKIADDHHIECLIIEKKGSKSEHEACILQALKKREIDWILLAGYMRILSPGFVKAFYNQKYQVSHIINIHPSLLPKFPGAHAYQEAYAAEVQTSGITIHFVDEGIDSGKVIVQAEFPRLKEDSFEDFKKRGLALEHELYPKVMEKIINNTLFEEHL